MKSIESFDNPKYKLAISLMQSKYRKKNQMFLAEGLRNVELAVDNPKTINLIFIQEDRINEPRYSNIIKNMVDKSFVVPSKLMETISDTVTSQGIVAICNFESFMIDDIDFNNDVLILDKIQDPGNLGTILRTADAAGISTVICTKGTTDIYSPKVVRSAMGSLMHLKILFIDDYESLNILKKNGYKIISSSLENALDYNVLSTIQSKIAIVLGNEANGIDDKLLNLSDLKVKIPLYGAAESLNVGIAGGILMYKLKERTLF